MSRWGETRKITEVQQCQVGKLPANKPASKNNKKEALAFTARIEKKNL
jgi:hypothetical protein